MKVFYQLGLAAAFGLAFQIPTASAQSPDSLWAEPTAVQSRPVPQPFKGYGVRLAQNTTPSQDAGSPSDLPAPGNPQLKSVIANPSHPVMPQDTLPINGAGTPVLNGGTWQAEPAPAVNNDSTQPIVLDNSTVSGVPYAVQGNSAGYNTGVYPVPQQGMPIYGSPMIYGSGSVIAPSEPLPQSVTGPSIFGRQIFGPSGVAVGGGYFNGRSLRSQMNTRTWFSGFYGLAMQANQPRNVFLAYPNGFPMNRYMTIRSADMETMPGAQALIGQRNCNGYGWMATYWGLYPGSEQAIRYGNPQMALPTLSYLTYDGGINPPANPNTVRQYMNLAQAHSLTRSTEIHSFEFNLLKSTCCQRNFNCACSSPMIQPRSFQVDWLLGPRYFKFDDDFCYSTSYDGSFTPDPRNINYNIFTRNNLYGMQLGNMFRWGLTKRACLFGATKVGVYANDSSLYTRLFGENGDATINTGAYAGQMYSVRTRGTSTALLGEFDVGLRYCLSNNWRAVIGYRVIGVNGIAFASNQIPYNFADIREAAYLNNDSSLTLSGGYAGLEYRF